MAYESTTVAVEKSQGEIRRLLVSFGASEFNFGETNMPGEAGRWTAVSFTHGGHTVLIRVPLKAPTDRDRKLMGERARRARTRSITEIENEHWDQEQRRIWRVLFWSLKSRMVAVEEGVETFEQAFLAHLVDPRTGFTIWQYVQPSIDSGAFQVGGGGMRALESPKSVYEND